MTVREKLERIQQIDAERGEVNRSPKRLQRLRQSLRDSLLAERERLFKALPGNVRRSLKRGTFVL